jgi:hypothetical protein
MTGNSGFNRRRDDELQRTLGKIEATLINVDAKLDSTTEYVQSISERTRALEQWRNGIAATVTALGAAMAYLFRGN